MASDDSERPYRQVPVLGADNWRNFNVFRETFLADVNAAEDNQALRTVANLLELGVSENPEGPPLPSLVDELADHLRAVLADIRYLQGYLGMQVHTAEWQRKYHEIEKDQTKRHDALRRIAADLQKKIGALADRLERALATAKLG